MKTSNSILSLLVGTLGLGTFSLFAGPPDEFTHSYIASTRYIESSNGATLFAVGDSASRVTNLLEEPDMQLSPTVWLYRRFPVDGNRDTRQHTCDNLLISFQPGRKPNDQRVAAIVMTNTKGLAKIERELQQNPRYLEDLLSAKKEDLNRAYIARASYLEASKGNKLFALGDSAAKVSNLLNKPDRQLTPSVWLYREFQDLGNLQTSKHFCDNLIVAFGPGEKPADQKVTAIIMANAKGVEKIERDLKLNPRYLEDLRPET
jgi:hypothetical protein